MNLIYFELKKVIDNRRIYVILLLIIGILIGLFLRNISMQSYIKNDALETVQSHLRTTYANLNIHRKTLEEFPDDKQANELLDISDHMKHLLFDLRTVTNNDWKQQLTLENEFLYEVERYKALDGIFPITLTDINETIAINEKLLKENIEPEHHTYSMATSNFLKVVIDSYIQLVAIIILLLLIGDVLTVEFERHSINFLLTQPIKRGSIVLSKLIVSMILYFLTMLMTIIGALGIGYALGNKGTFDYPVLIKLDNEITFITISEYVIYGLTLLTVLILFVVSLYFLCSLLFKQIIIALLLLFTILITGYLITLPLSMTWFNPLRNMFPKDVILDQNNGLWYEGIPILFVLTFLCYSFAYIKIKSLKVG